MKVDLQKMVSNFSCSEQLETLKYFKQFNIYETINCKSYIRNENSIYEEMYNTNRKIKICKIESTIPTVSIVSTKIICTVEGTSLEGQHLSGKKLIIVGEISLRLIVTYSIGCNKCNDIIIDVHIPFSTFIIIPKDICNEDVINLKYLIEDVSVNYLGNGKALVSVTILMQYLDEYLNMNLSE